MICKVEYAFLTGFSFRFVAPELGLAMGPLIYITQTFENASAWGTLENRDTKQDVEIESPAQKSEPTKTTTFEALVL